jgi:hypothetical protein
MDKLFVRTPSQKTFTKLGLVEWLKVKALSSSPSTAKKKKKKNSSEIHIYVHMVFVK